VAATGSSPHQPRLQVVAGSPTDEELAAVVAVVVAAAAAPAAPAAPARPPAWGRAALLEGVGGAPLASAADNRLA
jgi:hypothetical protein